MVVQEETRVYRYNSIDRSVNDYYFILDCLIPEQSELENVS